MTSGHRNNTLTIIEQRNSVMHSIRRTWRVLLKLMAQLVEAARQIFAANKDSRGIPGSVDGAAATIDAAFSLAHRIRDDS